MIPSNTYKDIIHRIFGAKISKLKPHHVGHGWFTCGPLMLYCATLSGKCWQVARFTPDHMGVLRAFEVWYEGQYYGKARGPHTA